MKPNNSKTLKCVVIGDKLSSARSEFTSAKSQLILTYLKIWGKTVSNNQAYNEKVEISIAYEKSRSEKQTYELAISNTEGQEEYDRLRPLSYANADFIVLIYSSSSPISVE